MWRTHTAFDRERAANSRANTGYTTGRSSLHPQPPPPHPPPQAGGAFMLGAPTKPGTTRKSATVWRMHRTSTPAFPSPLPERATDPMAAPTVAAAPAAPAASFPVKDPPSALRSGASAPSSTDGASGPLRPPGRVGGERPNQNEAKQRRGRARSQKGDPTGRGLPPPTGRTRQNTTRPTLARVLSPVGQPSR